MSCSGASLQSSSSSPIDSHGETVQVIADLAITPGALWQPVVGEETRQFLAKTHPAARDTVERDAVSILARGASPGMQQVSAGLVVGYVQSGKTTSFTAAATLARDNGFALVIVIAGTSTNLLDQTQERLQRDLELSESGAYGRWVRARSPRLGSEEARRVEAALDDWLDEDLEPEDRATVLVSVMKRHDHLQWLALMLHDIGTRIDLSKITALIVDDEADQASPNLKRQPDAESSTYGQIRRLRSSLPRHTLLEYTATPQATLLVSLVDELSPEFVCVIEPGEEYTGGKFFFVDHHAEFVRSIPRGDIDAVDESESSPPDSLLSAFATFILGCAAGRALPSGPSQRSMLIHPSRDTLPHERFITWVKSMRDTWAALLKSGVEDLDREYLVTNLLRPAYDDLARTAANLPPLDQLLRRLPGVLKKTSVVEVNAVRGRVQPIEWSTGYAWVLVGGQLLDRGFTVEGLTVTYMPRGVGVGNADTVQQRARFFGYKGSYAGYCRAWLDPEVDAAFRNYVEHEEAMRRELIEVARSGESLKHWKRVFLLDRRMSPTRRSVVRIDTRRRSFADSWFAQSEFDGTEESIYGPNRLVVDRFTSNYVFRSDEGDPRRDKLTQIHPCVDLPLGTARENLLQDYVMTDEDGNDFAALRVLLAVADERSDESCRVHLMMGNSPRTRMRSLNAYGRIKNLYQGSNASTGYPGDRLVRDNDNVTIQIHRLELRGDDQTDVGASAQLAGQDVPVLAIWVPARFEGSIIMQRAT